MSETQVCSKCYGTGEVCYSSTNYGNCPACKGTGIEPRTEPSPEPEASPTFEAQSRTSALYVTKAAYNVRLAELAQLRARVAILDAQEVELPKLPKPIRNSEFWDEGIEWAVAGERAARLERERQLLDALRAVQAQRTIMRELRNGLVAARDFIDSGNSGWFPPQWRDAIAAYNALAGKDGE